MFSFLVPKRMTGQYTAAGAYPLHMVYLCRFSAKCDLLGWPYLLVTPSHVSRSHGPNVVCLLFLNLLQSFALNDVSEGTY